MKWERVNGEPYEYAIVQGANGDEFVKTEDGVYLRRPVDNATTNEHIEWFKRFAHAHMRWVDFSFDRIVADVVKKHRLVVKSHPSSVLPGKITYINKIGFCIGLKKLLESR